LSEAAELLLALLGRGDPDLSSLRERAPSVTDLASSQELLPLLWHRLQERGAVDLSPIVLERFADVHTLASLRAEARRRQLRELLEALHAADVPVVLLKGAFLAAHAYPSDAIRPMGDLDLLVPSALLGTAIDRLVELGYMRPTARDAESFREFRHAPPLQHRLRRLGVELHDTIEPCAAPFTLPLADVWARAHAIPASEGHALALAPEDLLLHLATHMGYSHLLGTSILRVYDVALWVDRFGDTADWNAVVARAEASGVRRFVYAALGLAACLLAAPVPPGVLRRMRREPDDVAISVAARLLTAPEILPGATVLTWVHDNKWRRARRFARSLLVTSTLHSRDSERGVQQLDHVAHSRRYRARLSALTRLLVHPRILRISMQQAMRARYLLSWARRGGMGVAAGRRRQG
jgi:hypothetical protein